MQKRPKKLYVLVRKDLSPSQRAVQAGHAVAEFMLRGPENDWDNGTLVYLGVKDKHQLEKWDSKIKEFNRRHKSHYGWRHEVKEKDQFP